MSSQLALERKDMPRTAVKEVVPNVGVGHGLRGQARHLAS